MNEIEKDFFLAIQTLLKNQSLKDLKQTSAKLSKDYQTLKHIRFLSDKQRLSYIAFRMFATYRAIYYVLNEIKRLKSLNIQTILDLGAGPATSVWSYFTLPNTFSKNAKVNASFRLVEKDEKMLLFAKELLKDYENILKKTTFEKNDILKVKDYDYDLVLLSYVANELKNYQLNKIINRWAFSKSRLLVFIEPGSKYGFKNIKYIRQKLIDKGFNILAPCPNNLKCPMPKNDWCHFYVRVKRSKAHKYLKKASLGYEDEKFSYVVATKQKNIKPLLKPRILRYPKKAQKEILFTLCKDGKIQKHSIAQNDKSYKIAKKLNWGDTLDV